MDDPGLGPCGFRQDEIGTALLASSGLELAAHELGQGLDGDEEGIARGIPMAAVVGDAAAGDQAVDMGVEDELLGPGMQNGQHADGAADIASIAGQLDDGLGRGLHQQGVAVTLVGAQDVCAAPRAP